MTNYKRPAEPNNVNTFIKSWQIINSALIWLLYLALITPCIVTLARIEAYLADDRRSFINNSSSRPQ